MPVEHLDWPHATVIGVAWMEPVVYFWQGVLSCCVQICAWFFLVVWVIRIVFYVWWVYKPQAKPEIYLEAISVVGQEPQPYKNTTSFKSANKHQRTHRHTPQLWISARDLWANIMSTIRDVYKDFNLVPISAFPDQRPKFWLPTGGSHTKYAGFHRIWFSTPEFTFLGILE